MLASGGVLEGGNSGGVAWSFDGGDDRVGAGDGGVWADSGVRGGDENENGGFADDGVFGIERGETGVGGGGVVDHGFGGGAGAGDCEAGGWPTIESVR